MYCGMQTQAFEIISISFYYEGILTLRFSECYVNINNIVAGETLINP